MSAGQNALRRRHGGGPGGHAAAGLLGVVLDCAAFVVALPFTVPSGSVDAAAEQLVKQPMRYTFKCPLGELREEPQ